jgi:uncharacterized protein (UPF0332 family)
MTQLQTPETIFADARSMCDSAIQRLEAGDMRDAAEKAWCATRRATEALLMAKVLDFGHATTGMISDGLDSLTQADSAYKTLVGRYYSRISQLHGSCFYDGRCNSETERRIRETARYIDDAERLAEL